MTSKENPLEKFKVRDNVPKNWDKLSRHSRRVLLRRFKRLIDATIFKLRKNLDFCLTISESKGFDVIGIIREKTFSVLLRVCPQGLTIFSLVDHFRLLNSRNKEKCILLRDEVVGKNYLKKLIVAICPIDGFIFIWDYLSIQTKRTEARDLIRFPAIKKENEQPFQENKQTAAIV